jgi:hypothetical protein
MLRKMIPLALVALLSLGLAAPASAGRGSGFHGGHGSFHGGHGSFHHGSGFHGRSCCWNRGFVGGVFVGTAFWAPFYAYPYYPYAYPYPYSAYAPPLYTAPPAYQSELYLSQPAPREVCYVGGCYHLEGDGMTTAYHWVWVPNVPEAPPEAPTR